MAQTKYDVRSYYNESWIFIVNTPKQAQCSAEMLAFHTGFQPISAILQNNQIKVDTRNNVCAFHFLAVSECEQQI